MAISLESLKQSTTKSSYLATIYGLEGVGKTTFSSQFESPVFMQTEDGLNIPGVALWEIKSYQDVIEGINVLYSEDHSFKTLIIDSVTAFEPMLHAQLCKDENATSIEKIGGGFAKYRVESLPYWETVLKGLTALTKRGISVLIIGHSQVKEVKPPEVEPYLKYELDLINPKAANLLYRYSDIVGFANYKTMTSSTGEGVKKSTRGIGTGERVLHLEERPAHHAKNRFNLPAEMPFDCQSFNESIKAQQNQPTTNQ